MEIFEYIGTAVLCFAFGFVLSMGVNIGDLFFEFLRAHLQKRKQN